MPFSDRTVDSHQIDAFIFACILYAFFSSVCKVFSTHIVACFQFNGFQKGKTASDWWVNFLYWCATSTGGRQPPAPLLPDLLLASRRALAVHSHHSRPFNATTPGRSLPAAPWIPPPHPRSFSYRVSFSPTWAPWDDHIINFKIITWSMYFTASPCSTTCEVQKLLLVRVHLNPGQFISSKHIYFCSALIFLLNFWCCILSLMMWCCCSLIAKTWSHKHPIADHNM